MDISYLLSCMFLLSLSLKVLIEVIISIKYLSYTYYLLIYSFIKAYPCIVDSYHNQDRINFQNKKAYKRDKRIYLA